MSTRTNFRILIKRNGLDYACEVLAVKLFLTLEGHDELFAGPQVEDGFQRRMEPSVQVVFMDGQHRFAAKTQLASCKGTN